MYTPQHNHLFSRPLFRILTALTAMVLAAACASDDVSSEGEGREKVRINIELGTAELTTGSRAWTDVMANPKGGEMIFSAYVVMVDAAGKVKDIFNLAHTSGQEDERRNVASITSETGTYTFYSFANLPDCFDYTANNGSGKKKLLLKGNSHLNATATSANGIEITQDSNFGTAVEALNYTPHFNNFKVHPANNIPGGTTFNGIPMTNKEQFEVNSNVTVRLSLYRLLSKIQFTITNQTGKDIVMDKITMGSVTANENATPIKFLPPKDANNGVINSFNATDGHTTANVDFFDRSTSTGTTLANGSNQVFTGYLNESVSTHPTGQFPLTLKYHFKSDETSEGVVPEDKIITRFSLMKLEDIARNHAVLVPIRLTEYSVILKTFFYPPIGGYPSFSQEDHSEEGYYTLIFGGGGDLSIHPYVFESANANNPELWFELNDKTHIESYTITVEDPSHIFTNDGAPHFDDTTGELLATLNSVHDGTASVELTVRIKVSESETLTYKRTIYIIASATTP